MQVVFRHEHLPQSFKSTIKCVNVVLLDTRKNTVKYFKCKLYIFRDSPSIQSHVAFLLEFGGVEALTCSRHCRQQDNPDAHLYLGYIQLQKDKFKADLMKIRIFQRLMLLCSLVALNSAFSSSHGALSSMRHAAPYSFMLRD